MDLQGKREDPSRPKGKRESGRADGRRFELIPTLLPGRAHARPNRNRNRFPGWSHPPTFDHFEESIKTQVEVLNVTQTCETLDFSPSGHQTFRSWRRVLRTMYSTLLLRSCAQKLPKTLPWDPGDSRKSGKLSISDPRKIAC